MRVAVGLTECLGLDGDRCIRVITPTSVTPEVNLSSHTLLPSVNNGTHPGCETQSRRHQKSKTEVSVAPQNDMCPLKIMFKNYFINKIDITVVISV